MKQLKSLKRSVQVFILCLMMSLTVSCKTTGSGVDLCTLDNVKPFVLTQEEKVNLERDTKEQMVTLNCYLHEFCQVEIKNSSLCLPKQ